MAIVGIILAICALVITFYQVHLMHAQARIAVWPHLEQGGSFNGGARGARQTFTYNITNTGLGPAHIRYVTVKLDGKTVYGIMRYHGRVLMRHSWIAVVAKLVNVDLANRSKKAIFKKLANVHQPMRPGTVILQGKTYRLFQVYGATARRVLKKRPNLALTICYCSLYDDCWISRSDRARDERVSSCPRGKASGLYSDIPQRKRKQPSE